MEMASKKKGTEDAKRKEFVDNFLAGQEQGTEWEPIESGKNIKLAENESVEGTIIRLPYAAGKSNAFDIEIDSGDGTETVTYWSPTVLTNLLKKCKVGDYVSINCIGTIPTANGDAYDFALMRKKRG